MSYYSNDEIMNKVENSLEKLFTNDSFLLQKVGSERSVAHKLAEYLQRQFLDWNVDCEYNRKNLDIKILDGIRECSEQRKTDRVSPDIIVHKRNTNENLLVIEIKVAKDDLCDIKKLKKFTFSKGEYRYQLGLFIKFNLTEEPSCSWFNDGENFKII